MQKIGFEGYLIVIFCILLNLISNPAEASRSCLEALLGQPEIEKSKDASPDLGVDVASIYPNVRIGLGSNGEFIIPKGSKAFAYWRQRTPGWISDNAFALQYLKIKELQNSVADMSAAVAEDEAIRAGTKPLDGPEARTREEDHAADLRAVDPSFLSRKDLLAEWAEKVKTADESDRTSFSFGKTEYLYVEGVPGHSLVFFHYEEGMVHQRAKNLLLEAYPQAKVVFGGSFFFYANIFPDGSFSISKIQMSDGAWLKNRLHEWQDSEETLATMLVAIKHNFPLSRETSVRLMGDWQQNANEDKVPFDQLLNTMPIILNDELKAEGVITASEVKNLEYNEKLKEKLSQNSGRPLVSYLALKRPGGGMELIFFPKTDHPRHQYIFDTFAAEYPGSKPLFGGALEYIFDEVENSRANLISIRADAFLRDSSLEGISSLRALLQALSDQLQIFGDQKVITFDRQWIGVPEIAERGHFPTFTISELTAALKMKPGADRDGILHFDSKTGELSINKTSKEFTDWRQYNPVYVPDDSFAHSILPSEEYDMMIEKQEVQGKKKEIARIQDRIEFSDLTAGELSLRVPKFFEHLGVATLQEVLKINFMAERDNLITLKYLTVLQNGKIFVLGWDIFGPNHGTVVNPLLELNSGMKIVGGDILTVTYELRKDGSGKLASLTLKEHGGGMLLEDSAHDEFAPSEWSDLLHKDGLTAGSIILHQVAAAFSSAIDESTVIKQE